jgi:hypothetical protein
MAASSIEKVWPGDVLAKRERVERTLEHRPVDRAVLHEQVSYNAGVIAHYAGRAIHGFDYTYDDICRVIRCSLDACFPPVAPLGTGLVTDAEGYVIRQDNWHSMIVKRPFADLEGAREFVLRKTEQMRSQGRRGGYGFPPGVIPVGQEAQPGFNAEEERENYRRYMTGLQSAIGETVIIDFPIQTGFCDCWSRLGLETFIYLYDAWPEAISDYLRTFTDRELDRLHAIADPALTPVVLIPEDFASKGGPIFSPAFLRRELFPDVRRLTDAWHAHGLKVLYHSDGNWRSLIPDLVGCGVDGFYCLEPALGMDIVALRKAWPDHTWAGGLDGVNLMEQGSPAEVRAAVRRIISETDALRCGGIFIDTSSEINPPIRAENYLAMIEAAGELTNPGLLGPQ